MAQNEQSRIFHKKSGIPDFDQNVVPKRLISDFLQNGSSDLLHIGNLDESNEYPLFAGGPSIRKHLDLDLWIIFR